MLLLNLCWLALAFIAVLVLPAIPSIREVMRPKDDGRLFIAEHYVRDPRWFGSSFRKKLLPFVTAARESGPSRGEMRMRMDEDVQWAPDLNIPPLERLRGIGVGDRVLVGHGAGIRDAYALEALTVENDVVARTLTSDKTMQIGDGVHILRWIDGDGDIEVGAGTDLGLSASGGSRVTLGERVEFERVWGAPVASRTPAAEPFPVDVPGATVVDAAMLREGKSVIIYGPARVAEGTHIAGDLKVHGALALEDGSSVTGNVIARGTVTAVANVSVGGHVFAEGSVFLGPGTRVSRAGVAKTVYATDDVVLADNVEVFGWIVSESGGHTL